MFQIIKKYRKTVIHILVWLSFLTLILLQTYQINTEISKRIFLGTALNIFIFYINYGYLVPKFLLQKKTFVYLILAIILSAITLFVITVVLPIGDLQIP